MGEEAAEPVGVDRVGVAERVCPRDDCAAPEPAMIRARPRVDGKFLFVGDRKLYVKGVTYGPFRPDENRCEYGTPAAVAHDFRLMAEHGINALRTYTVPPRWLLDAAQQHGLRVLVGLPWEQHVTFLDDTATRRSIEQRLREGVRRCVGHPAILGYAIGNEIPAPIVRWYGQARVERFLRRLHTAAKEEDASGLVTYISYPTTEYLHLPFVDFLCFNVFLEVPDQLESYLVRLQTIAGEQPLVLAEIGLDSIRHGEEQQAHSLDWQVRTVLASGCAGTFVFSWTDEWFRGGYEIEDWAFGLTTRHRHPKPALHAVRRAFAEAPLPDHLAWPKISVVVCTYNGRRTIRECLEGLMRLDYPCFEVIVVDDGSTDDVAGLAGDFDVRLIRIENGGLSNARNVGMRAATGDFVADIDDDAYPDPHWLRYVAHTFMTTDHAGVGGPNLPPHGDGPTAECVAGAPGGPSHVLCSEDEVEHIPGCNMAFRKPALEGVGGFDAQFRIAGDDVDLCWRLQQQGFTLGFNPAAVVWHHRRSTVRAYLKQQLNYGKAEAMLEVKWPEKHNGFGHVSWKGHLYGQGPVRPPFGRRLRVYHGVWGTALFQSIYARSPCVWASLPLMPEWYLLVLVLAVVALGGVVYKPLLLGVPLLVLAVAVPVVQAGVSAARAPLNGEVAGAAGRIRQRLLIALLHLAQPAVRLAGRLRFGLTPWRRRGHRRFAFPRPRAVAIWSERWHSPEQRLAVLEATLRDAGGCVVRGGSFDRWDLEVRAGPLGVSRILMAIEEHGAGNQLVRFRAWPSIVPWGVCFISVAAASALLAAILGSWSLGVLLGLVAAGLAARALGDCASATATFLEACVVKEASTPS